MREIKFRGKSLKNGEWVYGYYLSFYYDNTIGDKFNRIDSPGGFNHRGHFILPLDSDCETDFIEVDPETIGQSTGIPDENGKEVYDGDILGEWVDTDEGLVRGKRQVFWQNESGCWMLDSSFGQDKTSGDNLTKELNLYIFEIIGNIHENPELLKSEVTS
jgi:uncharacterized phage protein (TIGR01671 family)